MQRRHSRFHRRRTLSGEGLNNETIHSIARRLTQEPAELPAMEPATLMDMLSHNLRDAEIEQIWLNKTLFGSEQEKAHAKHLHDLFEAQKVHGLDIHPDDKAAIVQLQTELDGQRLFPKAKEFLEGIAKRSLSDKGGSLHFPSHLQDDAHFKSLGKIIHKCVDTLRSIVLAREYALSNYPWQQKPKQDLPPLDAVAFPENVSEIALKKMMEEEASQFCRLSELRIARKAVGDFEKLETAIAKSLPHLR